ncbi:MAG: PASTA domain-containing protein [Bacteroidota bacterium]
MEKDKKEKRKFLKFLISRQFFIHLGLMIVVTIILIWLTFFFLKIYTNHGEAISVPDFTGMSIEEVEKLSEEKSLMFEVIDSVYSDDVSRGTIVNQVPLPNQKIKRNRTVYLTINAFAKQKVQVPDFTGLELRAANALAETYGLRICDKKYIPDISTTVIKQSYKGKEIPKGTLIDKGACIDLVIGRGASSEKVLVPKLIGLTKAEAEAKLADLALSIGGEIYSGEYSSPEDSAKAKIYRQNPMSYKESEIRIGSFIDIWLTLDESQIQNLDTNNVETSTSDND